MHAEGVRQQNVKTMDRFKMNEHPDVSAVPYQPDGFTFLKQLCGTTMSQFKHLMISKTTQTNTV